MIINLVDDLDSIMKNDYKKLRELKKAIEKSHKYICRGEISILDNKRTILQTHYEYFTISINNIMIKLERIDENKRNTRDYTHINLDNLIEYKISDTSMSLTGKLNGDLKIHLLIVFKYEIKTK